MRVPDECRRLLELLREAGDEAVTLDELEIVGVRDPARALLELELAGFAVQRVYEHPSRGRPVTCVRLESFDAVVPAPATAPLPVAHRGRRRPRPVVLVALGLLLLALGAAAGRRR
jgi:hypothetical protein